MTNIDEQKIEEILERWTKDIYPSKEEFLHALYSKKLVIYHGVDPTGPQLHLGHSTNYLFLKKLQELGHRVILLIGDFTAQVGDPTGKSKTRVALTPEQVKQNYKTYKEQAGKILNFSVFGNPIKVEFNSKWLARMTLKDIMQLLSKVTYARLTERSMIRERIDNHEDIYMHELLYPVLQGYDSVALNTDVEVGGSDQTFNMLMGRGLVKIYNKKEKFVITTPLLENPKTGKKLMSKSEGGFVALNDDPNNMYGKIMAIPDEAIYHCFKLCTEISIKEIKEITKTSNPRDQKAALAKEIVKMYHGEKEAQKVEEEFNRVFRDKQIPDDIAEFTTDKKMYPILDLLCDTRLAESKNDAKRVVEGGGVSVIASAFSREPERGGKQSQKVQNWREEITIEDGMVIRFGKRKFIKITLK